MFALFNYIHIKYHNLAHENSPKLPVETLLNVHRINGMSPYPSFKHPSNAYRELVNNKLVNDDFHGDSSIPWYDTDNLSQITIKGEKLIRPLIRIEKSFVHWFMSLIITVFAMGVIMTSTNVKFRLHLGHGIRESTANFALNWGMVVLGIILLIGIGYICLKLINKIDLYRYHKTICIRKLYAMSHHKRPSHQR